MARGRCVIELRFGSLVAAQTARLALLADDLGSFVIDFEDLPVRAFVQTTPRVPTRFVVTASLRLRVRSEATTFYNRLRTRMDGAAMLSGSRISEHTCPHDEAIANWYNCRDHSSYREFVKP